MAIFDLIDFDDLLIHQACLLYCHLPLSSVTSPLSERAELTLGPST